MLPLLQLVMVYLMNTTVQLLCQLLTIEQQFLRRVIAAQTGVSETVGQKFSQLKTASQDRLTALQKLHQSGKHECVASSSYPTSTHYTLINALPKKELQQVAMLKEVHTAIAQLHTEYSYVANMAYQLAQTPSSDTEKLRSLTAFCTNAFYELQSANEHLTTTSVELLRGTSVRSQPNPSIQTTNQEDYSFKHPLPSGVRNSVKSSLETGKRKLRGAVERVQDLAGVKQYES
jgi:hypothetical protein